MTSPTDEPPGEPRLEPGDEAAVRRLLADARATDPVPPAVAERLDATLAGLVAGRDGASEPAGPELTEPALTRRADGAPVAPVVPLAGRRRRTASLLMAAAAVVVGGVAVGGYLAGDGGDRLDAGSDAGAQRGDQDDAGAADAEAAPSDASSEGPGKLAHGTGEISPSRPRTPLRVPILRPDRLQADLVRLQERWLAPGAAATGPTMVVVPRGFRCDDARWGAGFLIGVDYDDRPAIAAFRVPKGDNQVVEVLQCGTAEVLRSTTISSR